MPHIVFTKQAGELLTQSMAKELVGNPHARDQTVAEFEAQLLRLFPDAETVLVQKLAIGFRRLAILPTRRAEERYRTDGSAADRR